MYLKQQFKLISLVLAGVLTSALAIAAPADMSFAAQAQYIQQIYNQVPNYSPQTTPQTAQAAITYYFSNLLQQAQNLSLPGAYSSSAMTSTSNSKTNTTSKAATTKSAAPITPPPTPSALPTAPTAPQAPSNPIPSGFSD